MSFSSSAARIATDERLEAQAVDWSRLGRRATFTAMVAFAVVQLLLQARGTQYGIDFRGGTWGAGHALLSGHSPYPAPDAARLLRRGNGFIDPPLLAELGLPFSLLPFAVAVVAFNLLCALSLLVALVVVGVRDWRVYALSLCSFPFISSLGLGQPDALFVLAAAVGWRYRDSWRGALAIGALIAAKFLAWPLLIWLVARRRFLEAAVAAASAVTLLAGSWAIIGFKGLMSYSRLVAADARAFETRSHSWVTALVRTGISEPLAVALTIAAAVVVGLVVVAMARRSDLGCFTAALAVGLLSSPLLWQHYLVVLLIPLAALDRNRDPLAWLLIAALWLSPTETPRTLWQAWLVPLIACALVLRVGALSRKRQLVGTGPAHNSVAV